MRRPKLAKREADGGSLDSRNIVFRAPTFFVQFFHHAGRETVPSRIARRTVCFANRSSDDDYRRMMLVSAVATVAGVYPIARFSLADVATASQQPDAQAQHMVDLGLEYLKKQQQPDGGWQQTNEPPAITAIAIKAFVQDKKYAGDEPFLQKAFAKLLSYQKEDGSISDDNLATYNTAIALSALGMSKQAEYKKQMEKALGYLREIQWTDKVEGVPANMKVPESTRTTAGSDTERRASTPT